MTRETSSVSSEVAALGPRAPSKSLSVWRELAHDQAPIVLGVLGLAVAASYLQHGFLVGGDRPFPLAGISVPLWHLLWLGFWTGYTMALVGEATGIFSLPYAMSILRFDNVHVSPTNLVITAINPVGALLGFRRAGQWNLDFALWPCLGALLGSQVGPLIRVGYLSDPAPFKALVGLALFWMGLHLVWEITPWYLRKRDAQRLFTERFRARAREMAAAGRLPSGIPEGARIDTLDRSWRRIRIGFLDQEWTLSVPLLLLLGAGVGVVASTLGVGGGFLMTPLLVTLFKLPMYVIVAATIPFVMLQSMIGLFSYMVVVPALTGHYDPPEWAFGLFTAGPAVFGAWLAAKTQRFVAESNLKLIAGMITGLGGVLYLINYFVPLPFRI
jgi:uncharacterized membrane protein YfcA